MSTLRATAREKHRCFRTLGARTGGPGCHRVQTSTHETPNEMSPASPVAMHGCRGFGLEWPAVVESPDIMSGAELSANIAENFGVKLGIDRPWIRHSNEKMPSGKQVCRCQARMFGEARGCLNSGCRVADERSTW
jgi:hypothetical protein